MELAATTSGNDSGWSYEAYVKCAESDPSARFVLPAVAAAARRTNVTEHFAPP